MDSKTTFQKFFSVSENIIYFIAGILLFITALFLIADIFLTFLDFSHSPEFIRWIVSIFDRILLLLMVIEIFYTVHISFKNHILEPEPFLIVGLIAAIRRILVISVESAYIDEKFDNHMIEISILGILILIFVFSIIYIRKYSSAR
jgi:uncharacterized membrane protein (DUF373 family)